VLTLSNQLIYPVLLPVIFGLQKWPFRNCWSRNKTNFSHKHHSWLLLTSLSSARWNSNIHQTTACENAQRLSVDGFSLRVFCLFFQFFLMLFLVSPFLFHFFISVIYRCHNLFLDFFTQQHMFHFLTSVLFSLLKLKHQSTVRQQNICTQILHNSDASFIPASSSELPGLRPRISNLTIFKPLIIHYTEIVETIHRQDDQHAVNIFTNIMFIIYNTVHIRGIQ